MKTDSLDHLDHAGEVMITFVSVRLWTWQVIKISLSLVGSFFFFFNYTCYSGFLLVQMVQNLSSMQETWVQYPGREDPLDKGMASHSSIFAWKIQWTEESGRLQTMWSWKVGHDWADWVCVLSVARIHSVKCWSFYWLL